MNILKCIIYWLSIIADAYTIYNGVDNVAATISKEPPFLLNIIIYILLIVSIFFVFIYTVAWIINRKCKRCGTRNIPCSWYYFFRAKIKNKTNTALNAMHSLYHSMYEQEEKIRNNRDRYNDLETIKIDVIKPFLQSAKRELQNALGIKVNISIKLLTVVENQYILETYAYLMDRPSENRDMQNNYILLAGDKDLLVDLKLCHKVSKNYSKKHGNGKYAINSIFNFLMIHKNNTDWMSNDIDIDEKNEEFFSSSDNRNCYKSLGIFVIKAPKIDSSDVADVGPLKGFLTFDSVDPNIFVEKECREIMGFIAHCLYEIINETYHVSSK